MRFLYLRDPLFRVTFAVYWINRWGVKPYTQNEFIHGHFNDFLCIPFFVPFVVYIARVLRLRSRDGIPTAIEIFIPLVVWSIMFELILPQHPYWSKWVTGDPFDILWYSAGALVAAIWWRFYYGRNTFRDTNNG